MVMGLRRFFKNYIYKKKFKITNSETENIINNQSILITGANSGIGLALTKKFLEFNNKVIATFKQNNDNLLKLDNKNLSLCKCDQSNLQNIDNLIKYVKDTPINVVINNAGIWGGERQNFNNLNYKDFISASNINAISIIKICEIVLKYSEKKSLNSVINITSLYGSTDHNTTGRDYIYKGTKSMMNSFSKNLSIDLKKSHGVNVFSICPGSVKTKLNPGGVLNPEIVALNIINTLKNSNSLNGKFIDLNKNELAW